MKKRIVNAVQLLLIIVSYIMLSIANIKLVSGGAVSVLGASKKYALQFYPMCVLYLVCAIMCIVSIVSKKAYKDGKIHSILAVILFFITNWNMATCVSSDEIAVNNFPVLAFEIILFLAVVISFVKRSPLIAPTVSEQPQVVNNIQETSNADELLKYKNLLDQGAITQEEYDKKKSELLNQ